VPHRGSSIARVLCPVDLSGASVRCLAHAAAVARWRRAHLTVLHVESPLTQRLPPTRTEEWSDPRAHQSDYERIRQQVDAFLAEAGEPAEGVDLLVDLGMPVTHILDRAAMLPADLIVIATHGHGSIERFMLGSVAEKVLRGAACDVLVVPAHAPPHTASTTPVPLTSILCGVDFSDCSQRALTVASELAAAAGARLTVLHAIGWPWDEPSAVDLTAVPPEQAAALGELRRYLETGASARLRDLVVTSSIHADRDDLLVRHGRADRELLRAATERRADLIVLGVRGRGPAHLAVFGSTTNQIVRQAVCPVWVARLPKN
jgi:nucleotide-binding universal stress UspA family protein